jgi:xanthine dehydrogenase accessory factor
MAIAGILLAAGSATRMGRNKLLVDLEGEPLVRRAARRALAAGLDPVLVVVGHEADRVGEALSGLPVRLVPNPGWAGGQGTSLAAGAAAVPDDAEGAVVLLPDMPLVTADMIRAVAARHRETGSPVVSSRYGEVTAPPVLYHRSVLPEFRGASGEAPGREVIRRLGDRVLRVDWPAAALADVDLPADLARLRGSAAAAGGMAAGAGASDEEVLERAAAWMEAGRGVAIATVTSTWGSSLRPAGSQLAVNDRGELAGSVSGGCVESAVAGEAMAAIADGKLRRLRYGVTDERAWEVGLPCGGTVEVAVKPADPELLRRLRADLAARRPVVLALDLMTGAERLVHPGEPGEEPPTGAEVFLRPFDPPVRLVLVGAVHVAQALAHMAQAAGYETVVVDPRRAFATPERFPGVQVVAGWPAEALSRLSIDRRTAVVTLAHDPKIDDPALAAGLRAGCFYVGALGSRKSHAARLARLREEGFGEADLARIHGPVGLGIGAVTPGEIATSILAQVVEKVRAERSWNTT